jgi:TonB family protein
MSRKLLIAASILAHAGLAVGVFVSNIWTLERLDPDRRAMTSLAVMAPPAPASGGADRPSQALRPKRAKVKPPVLTQPPAAPAAIEPLASGGDASDATGTGSGDGPGSGSGSGAPDGPGTCTEDCGEGPTLAPPPVADPPAPRVVAPNVLQGLRISGDPQIHPSSETQARMVHADHRRSVGVVKACVSATGAVTSVAIVASTRYPEYDARLLAGVRGWRYQPYTVNHRAIPVCGLVTFVYSIR